MPPVPYAPPPPITEHVPSHNKSLCRSIARASRVRKRTVTDKWPDKPDNFQTTKRKRLSRLSGGCLVCLVICQWPRLRYQLAVFVSNTNFVDPNRPTVIGVSHYFPQPGGQIMYRPDHGNYTKTVYLLFRGVGDWLKRHPNFPRAILSQIKTLT